MTIQSILYRNGAEVIAIRAKETVRSAADKMRERSIAALVVKSGDTISGLITRAPEIINNRTLATPCS
jgi:CBS domain-containing protein